MTIINKPCAVYQSTRIVTPRRRVVMGGRHETVNGQRRYIVNTRWLCEWPVVYTNGYGVTRIVMMCDWFSEWTLQPVADMELEAVA